MGEKSQVKDYVDVYVGQKIYVYGLWFVVTGIDVSTSSSAKSIQIVGCDPSSAETEQERAMKGERLLDQLVDEVVQLLRGPGNQGGS